MSVSLHRVLDGPRFIALVDALVALPWPVAHPDIDPALRAVGFAPTADEGVYHSGLGVSNDHVLASSVRTGLSSVGTAVTDVDTNASPQRDAFVQDAFAGLVRSGIAQWGEPAVRHPGRRPKVVWFAPNGCNVILRASAAAVHVNVQSPELGAAARRLQEF